MGRLGKILALLIFTGLSGCMSAEIVSVNPSTSIDSDAAGLPRPAKGYGWYRFGGEDVLVQKATGIVAKTRSAPKMLPPDPSPFGR
jgi:hypothetical protein